MSRTIRMYVWRDLTSLRGYSDGLLCVIASSLDEAHAMAVADLCGTRENDYFKSKRAETLADLIARPPEIIARGTAYVHGGE